MEASSFGILMEASSFAMTINWSRVSLEGVSRAGMSYSAVCGVCILPGGAMNARFGWIQRLVSCSWILAMFLGISPSVAETRGYAIWPLITAAYTDKDNCPRGGNGANNEIRTRILLGMGYTREEAAKVLADAKDEGAGRLLKNRGRLNGQPADVLVFPASVPDPQIETAQGRYAYGFNLSGHVGPNSFEDPETHELGVENQMWRVLGCFGSYQVRVPTVPYVELNEALIDSMPAWVISISGTDLGSDGDVTVTFDRALNLLMRDAQGSGILHGASYTIDPDPRSHNVFKGHIRNQVLTVDPDNLFLLGESPAMTVFRMTKTHMRLKLEPDGALHGFIGGYQPWLDYYHFLTGYDDGAYVNMPGVYYAMKRLADADPDPVTGQNMAISATYYIRAVPAHLVTVDKLKQQ
jgi:hypothetical protein